MDTTIEAERKFDVPDTFQLPDLRGVGGIDHVGDAVTHRLAAVYYDTEDMRLIGRRITLRRRTGGHDAGWHLKRPAGGERSEARLALTDGLDVPAEFVDQVWAHIRGETLAPVADIRTRRVERKLCAADGRILAELADDYVRVYAPEPMRWHEIEVELVDGDASLFDAVTAALVAAGARPASGPSKLARALGDRQPAPAAPVPAGSDGGALVAAYLRAQRDSLIAMDPGVRGDDADAVHDMRIACRRARSTLRTLRPDLDAERTEPLRAELGWFSDLLGARRDADVMAARLDALLADQPAEIMVGPVAERMREHLAGQARASRSALVEAMSDQRYARMLDTLDAVVDGPLPSLSEAGLRARVHRALRRADGLLDIACAGNAGAAAREADAMPGGARDQAFHTARKAYKRARYAVELVERPHGKPAHRLVKRLKRLQDILGDHQDAVVTAALLRAFADSAAADDENAYTYGVLYAGQWRAAAAILDLVPAARRKAGAPGVRRWLSVALGSDHSGQP